MRVGYITHADSALTIIALFFFLLAQFRDAHRRKSCFHLDRTRASIRSAAKARAAIKEAHKRPAQSHAMIYQQRDSIARFDAAKRGVRVDYTTWYMSAKAQLEVSERAVTIRLPDSSLIRINERLSAC